jgi:hypothetical protein
VDLRNVGSPTSAEDVYGAGYSILSCLLRSLHKLHKAKATELISIVFSIPSWEQESGLNYILFPNGSISPTLHEVQV